MIAHGSYVMCDECGDPAPIVTNGAKEARAAAKRRGFVRVGRRDLCFRCDPDNQRCIVCGVEPDNWLFGCTGRGGLHRRNVPASALVGEGEG